MEKVKKEIRNVKIMSKITPELNSRLDEIASRFSLTKSAIIAQACVSYVQQQEMLMKLQEPEYMISLICNNKELMELFAAQLQTQMLGDK